MGPKVRGTMLLASVALTGCSFSLALEDCRHAGRCEGAPSLVASTVVARPDTALADGKSAVTVTVTVVDAKGRPVRWQLVTLAYDGGMAVTPWPLWTDSAGVATFSLTATAPVAAEVTAQVDERFVLAQRPAVRFVPEWSEVAAGWDFTLAVKGDGTLWAWGGNSNAQLGDGSDTQAPRPVQVGAGERFTLVAAGDGESGALAEGGLIDGWGYATWLKSPPTTPTALDGGLTRGFVSIAAGAHHFLAIHGDGGTVWSWGSAAENRLGDGLTSARGEPAPVGGLRDVAAVAAGRAHSLAVQADGGLWVWGTNARGQLGKGDTNDVATPTQLASDLAFVAVAAGESHSLAIKGDGSLWAWGSNDFSQLGIDSVDAQLTPKRVLQGSFTQVAAGWNHGLALTDGGVLYAWGCSPAAPTGTRCSSPQPIGSGFTRIAGGGWHSAAIKQDGSLWLWGSNESGQLGDGSGPGVRPRLERLSEAGNQ